MNNEMIKKYAIKLQNEIDNGIIEKSFNSNFGALNLMLFECSLRDINDDEYGEGLLTQIDDALANPNSEIESGCGIVEISIYQDVIKFYVNGRDDIDSMPTVDFREIIVGWRDFLLQSPLNGTRTPNIFRSFFSRIFQ